MRVRPSTCASRSCAPRGDGRDERAQAQQEVLRLEAQHVPPIGEAALHLMEHGAVGRAAQATLAERRPQSVAGEVLEAGAIARVHRGARVQRVAVLLAHNGGGGS